MGGMKYKLANMNLAKKLLPLLGGLVVGLSLIFWFFCFASRQDVFLNEEVKLNPSFKSEVETGEVILLAVGDIMLDRGVAQLVNKKGGGDFAYVFENIRALKGEADILWEIWKDRFLTEERMLAICILFGCRQKFCQF